MPNTIAVLPCAFSCWAKSWASEATWKGRKTTLVELVTLATSEEKSVAFWLTDSLSTLTPAFFRSASDDAREAGRVGLLVVDDHDRRALGDAEVAHHVGRVGRALDAVVGDVAEEVALAGRRSSGDVRRRAGRRRRAPPS